MKLHSNLIRLAVAAVILSATLARAATFTVTSAGDTPDPIPGDGICGYPWWPFYLPCTLRAAIQEANASAGPTTIDFNIPTFPQGTVPTITPGSALPTIVRPVVIDGTTQGWLRGPHRVEINGANVHGGGHGLSISAGSSHVRGLVINRFMLAGVYLDARGGNFLEANLIGTNVDGTAALGNGTGVIITQSSPNNTIGGVGARRNVISGNADLGIILISDGNSVFGNFIGTNAAGTAAMPNGEGTRIFSGGNLIGGTGPATGNLISGNRNTGVRFFGPNARGNQVLGNFIGTDISGTVLLSNSIGVSLEGAPNNTVGGTVAQARNVISANQVGVSVSGVGATGNQVQGNFIGTTASGTVGLGNGYGVSIEQASNNIIGGTVAGVPNVISSNSIGVSISGVGATGNLVQGNLIGTNAAGIGRLPNGYGVYLQDASSNLIGGTLAAARNLISGNSNGLRIVGSNATGNLVQGNFIGTDPSGTGRVPNSFGVYVTGSNNLIGGTAAGAGNVISGNGGLVILDGIGLQIGGTGNQVQGNLIGTDVTGIVALSNRYFGVSVGGSSNIIGGTAAGAANVISGNGDDGILISGTGHQVQGNLIGTNAAGTAGLPNANGVHIENASNCVVGPGNAISGNQGSGVAITSLNSSTTSNQVVGNLIGTDATGTIALGNMQNGVVINGPNQDIVASDNIVGGSGPGARNIIAGNALNGVRILGRGARSNQLLGNFIGTNQGGTAALANALRGVQIDAAPNNILSRNVISGNQAEGIRIRDPGATGNVVRGNMIGTDVSGTGALGNGADGVHVDGQPNNTIGGTADGDGNVIAFNGFMPDPASARAGVYIEGDTAIGNGILSNSIFGNAGLGIDLDPIGVNPNTPGGPHLGPNNHQNFPVVASATSDGSQTIIQGSLNSTANTTFRLEFFSNPSCDPSGFGQGQTFVGSTTAATDDNGDASFSLTFPTAVAIGQLVTATATDAGNNTSEFSQCAAVTPM